MFTMLRNRGVRACGSGAALAAAVAAVLYLSTGAAATAGPRAAAAPTQTIDAKTDPAAAGKALSDFCQVIANCQFVVTQPTTVSYDDPRILGDALYNCGASDAEDVVAISDERSESTSVDEALSTKVKLGFLGLAKASIEAEVNSKQLDEVATTLEQTNAVAVAPGTIGYTETRVPTAYLSGDAHVTNGVELIAVKNLALTYPGYGNAAINKVDWTDVHKDMTAQDRQSHCANLPALYPVAAIRSSKPPSSVSLVVCAARSAPSHGGAARTGSRRQCSARRLETGTGERIPRRANAALARGHDIYATGTTDRSGVVVHTRRAIRDGAYELLLSAPHDDTMFQVTVR
jgi:hypothetical protein